MNRNDSPCNHCTIRILGCHGSCKRYKKWRKEMDKERDMIYEAKQKESIVSGYQASSIRNSKFKSNKKVKH